MILEIFIIGIIIGFVFGYFSSNWMWTSKIADILDKKFNNKKE